AGALSCGAAGVNLSLAGPSDPLLTRLLDEAAARGIVIVAAEPPPGAAAAFPAAHRSALVARSSSAAGAASGGNRLPAPADEVLTTTPGGGYAFFSGTSLAAAHLSGIIALMIEREPGIAAGRLFDVLSASTVTHANGASVNACVAVESLTDLRICDAAPGTAGRTAVSDAR